MFQYNEITIFLAKYHYQNYNDGTPDYGTDLDFWPQSHFRRGDLH